MANYVIYRDLLLKNRHGLPLWKPDPNANLPEAYTKQGITIGDLGLLTDDGGFDYLFNIHAEAHDPVNELGTPPSFSPIPLNIANDVNKTVFQHPEKACIARNASFEVKSNLGAGIHLDPAADASLVVEFTITEEHAAMLVLPHGADRYDAKAYGKYRAYIIEHAKSWYEYLNQERQCEARNGTLYLVTGGDKTCSWGLAAGSPHQERTVGFHITTGPLASGTVGIHASWRNTSGVESRHYPPSTTGITENKNQCVFARGFVIGINENFFKKKWAGTVRIEQIASSSKSFPVIGNTVPFQSPRRTISPGASDSLQAQELTDLLDSEQKMMNLNLDDPDPTSGVFIWDYPEYPKSVLSPGSYICEHLLFSRSDIDVVVVHDNDWITATSSDADSIFTSYGTDYERLTTRVLEMCHPINGGSAALSHQDHAIQEDLPKSPLEWPRASHEDIEEFIRCHREALELRPASHPSRSDLLSSLGGALSKKFESRGNIEDLEESIQCYREAMDPRHPPHDNRSDMLNDFANVLLKRFERLGDIENLEESIECFRHALALRPAPSPLRGSSLNNLANALSARFQRSGEVHYLTESIQLHREALMLAPAPHPNRSDSLNDLASALFRKSEHFGDINALEESILHYRQALDLRPAPHPSRSVPLDNLASALFRRFQRVEGIDDLKESIRCSREALKLRPSPHRNRSDSLNTLASALFQQFERFGDIQDLDESILYYREVLELKPAWGSHPNRSDLLSNLASGLFRRYERLKRAHDLRQSILYYEEAVELRPAPHPNRPGLLNNLAIARSAQLESLELDREGSIGMWEVAGLAPAMGLTNPWVI